MDKELTLEEKQATVEQLKKIEATEETIRSSLMKHNEEVQETWDKKSYQEHQAGFEKDYYPLWNDQDKYKEKLAAMKTVPVDGALEGSFVNQQPEEHTYWKSRSNERKKIAEYKARYKQKKVCFDKNTVREMSALSEYQAYHQDYFRKREQDRALYQEYVEQKEPDVEYAKQWRKNINAQRDKLASCLEGAEGPLAELRDEALQKVYGEKQKKNAPSYQQEIDGGLRAFFAMEKKTFFSKKQMGLLGTETEEEKRNGAEYNTRLLRTYTKGSREDRVKVMDELADKILAFRLTPMMFTNQYLAKNMLQMQRYTDMLKGFATLTLYNHDYLDVKNNEAAHTTPERAALIRSRIILMMPIMDEFMQKHGTYFGYKKKEGIQGENRISEEESSFENEEAYNEYARKTWEKVKLAHNSTSDFLSDYADMKLKSAMDKVENKAKERRAERKKNCRDEKEDDSRFVIRYDMAGERAKELLAIQNKIASNPYVYEIFGGEQDTLFRRLGEMVRRLDEVETRMTELKKLSADPGSLQEGQLGDFRNMWKTYVEKQTVRLEAEFEILMTQTSHYKKALDYLSIQTLDTKDLKLSEPSEEVKEVVKYENLNHVFELKKAYEYNDLFYKTLDFYDFDTYKDFVDKDGNKVEIKDLWTRYQFTLLKQGMERARKVNRQKDGKTTVTVSDVSKLNNLEKRELCAGKYDKVQQEIRRLRKEAGTDEKAKAELLKYEFSLKEIASADMEKLTEEYRLSGELDITKDDTYVKYFRVKSIADLARKLERDPEGKNIPGFRDLTEEEQTEIRIRSELFRDHFRSWEGKMEYTRSEAYGFLGKVDDMQGNNPIIEGINRQYRKNAMSETFEKLHERQKEETDPEKQEMLKELETFFHGMVLENDYKAKKIKIFNKEAYDSYKTAYLLKQKKEEMRKVYTADYEDLVKKGIQKEDKKNLDRKIDERIDTALTLQDQVERYLSNRKESFRDYGVEGMKEADLEKTNLFLNAMKQKEKGGELTPEEKGSLVLSYYQKYVAVVKKMKAEWCSEAFLKGNLGKVLEDLRLARDFQKFLSTNKGENGHILYKVAGFSMTELDDLDRYREIVRTMEDYVFATLYDYGIKDLRKGQKIVSRDECKRELIKRDRSYTREFASQEKALKDQFEQAKEKSKNREAFEKEFREITRLYEEEEKRGCGSVINIRRNDNAPADANKAVSVLPKNKYSKRFHEMQRQDMEYYEEMVRSLQILDQGMKGIFDDKVNKEEEKEGKRSDYIEISKEKFADRIEELSSLKPLQKARNYVEELFRYLEKNGDNSDPTDPKVMTELLRKASKARFRLSAGARTEAERRLRLAESGLPSMEDFSIYENARAEDAVLAERAKVFGQDSFVTKNIKKIRTIMDAIGEANASVNDMQTPEFLDNLKDKLEVKGIDERQFMFLLRKHHVGFSGLSHTSSDVNKAMENEKDVHAFLSAGTRNEFLINTAREVLKAGKELKLKNINEDYILSHFEDCYFTANRMMAFQQLYYSEKETFMVLENYGEYRNLIREIKRRFDKGQGETYALYYNAVMGVAEKYGVSGNGALDFGLSRKEVEKLRSSGESDPEISARVKENLEKAEKRTSDSFSAIAESFRKTEISETIQDVMDSSLAGVDVKLYQEDRSLIDDAPDLKENVKEFYREFDEAYLGAVKYNEIFKMRMKDPDIVTYTNEDSFYPQFLFLMAKNQPLDQTEDKIRNKEMAENFKNFYTRDEKSVAKNLSVIDEKKCRDAMGLVHYLKLDQGSIPMEKKKLLYGEEWLDQNFSKELYENLVNAQNLCMMFEMKEDFMQLEEYDKQTKKQLEEGRDAFQSLYENHKPMYNAMVEEYNLKTEPLDQKRDQLEMNKNRLKELEKKKASEEDPKAAEQRIERIRVENQRLQQEIGKLEKDVQPLADRIIELEGKMNSWKKRSNPEEYTLATAEKNETLRNTRKFFSDKKTRFLVSTYFNLFNSWLLKKGVKLDGSSVNSEVYDSLLRERTRVNFTDREGALRQGDEISKMQQKTDESLYKARLAFIESGEYEKEYEARVSREKEISNRKEKERRQLEDERQKQEKLEAERKAKEEKERQKQEKLEAERKAKEERERQKLEAEQKAREEKERQKQEKERKKQEKLEAERKAKEEKERQKLMTKMEEEARKEFEKKLKEAKKEIKKKK